MPVRNPPTPRLQRCPCPPHISSSKGPRQHPNCTCYLILLATVKICTTLHLAVVTSCWRVNAQGRVAGLQSRADWEEEDGDTEVGECGGVCQSPFWG